MVSFSNLLSYNPSMDFPGGISGEESTCQYRRHKKRGFGLWIRDIPWRRKWQPTLLFSSGESHGQKSLEGCSPWGYKESGTTELLSTLSPLVVSYLLGFSWSLVPYIEICVFEQWGSFSRLYRFALAEMNLQQSIQFGCFCWYGH